MFYSNRIVYFRGTYLKFAGVEAYKREHPVLPSCVYTTMANDYDQYPGLM